jgi:cell division protein FtsL
MKEKGRSKNGRIPSLLWIVLLVLFMAELLVYSWCRVQYVHTGYEMNQEMERKQRLLALNYELKVEEARLRSPERIRRLAQERGLVIPDPKQIVVLP